VVNHVLDVLSCELIVKVQSQKHAPAVGTLQVFIFVKTHGVFNSLILITKAKFYKVTWVFVCFPCLVELGFGFVKSAEIPLDYDSLQFFVDLWLK
jgi:hypothetical protein